MSNLQLSYVRRLAGIVACAIGLIGVSAPTASATSINFALSTSGCFGLNCTNFSTTAQSDDLKFTGVTIPTFSVDTGGDSELLTFGTFALVPPSGNATQIPTNFTLALTFTSPTLPSDPQFTVTIQGFVNPSKQIDFTLPDDATLLFTTPTGQGSFRLDFNDPGNLTRDIRSSDLTARLGDVTYREGSTAAASPVPEPASMLLLGTGLLGTAIRARRQKKN